jgi:hypothetical protein
MPEQRNLVYGDSISLQLSCMQISRRMCIWNRLLVLELIQTKYGSRRKQFMALNKRQGNGINTRIGVFKRWVTKVCKVNRVYIGIRIRIKYSVYLSMI